MEEITDDSDEIETDSLINSELLVTDSLLESDSLLDDSTEFEEISSLLEAVKNV